MNMVGISCPRRFSSWWRSGPLMPGIETSSIRQFVLSMGPDARNSSADEKARASKPNSRIRSGSESRTDSSSSTMDKSGRSAAPLSSLRDCIRKRCDISRGTSIVLRYWVRADLRAWGNFGYEPSLQLGAPGVQSPRVGGDSQREMEAGAPRRVVRGPKASAVRLNNGLADTKPHPGAVFLGGKESVEYLAGLVQRKPDASVFNRYKKGFFAIALGTNCELTRAIDGFHGVDAIDHQVHEYLLQLDAVRHNDRQIGCEPCLYRNRVLDGLIA